MRKYVWEKLKKFVWRFKMDTPSFSRQDKRDSKKKQSTHSVYSSKHTRISAAISEKSSKSQTAPSKTKSKK
jgi:hypothetical protein